MVANADSVATSVSNQPACSSLQPPSPASSIMQRRTYSPTPAREPQNQVRMEIEYAFENIMFFIYNNEVYNRV